MDDKPGTSTKGAGRALAGGAVGFVISFIPLVMFGLPLAFAISGRCVDSEGVPAACGFSFGWVVVWVLILLVPLLTWLGAKAARGSKD